MKKLYTLFAAIILGLVLVSCGSKTEAVNTENLEFEIAEVEERLEGIEVLDEVVINALEKPLGEKFMTKALKDEADQKLKDARDLLNSSSKTQSEIDAMVITLKDFKIVLAGGITIGLKLDEVEISLEGLNHRISGVQSLLSGVIIGVDENSVAYGQKFLKEQEYNDAHDLLNFAIGKTEEELNETELEDLIDQLSALQVSLVLTIKVGTQRNLYAVNLDNLDLGGKTIKFYTHVMAEDNPYLEGFTSSMYDPNDYIAYLDDLQATYNFTLDFQTYKDYDEQVEEISILLRTSNDSSILRFAETKVFMDHIKADNIAPITDVVNSLQQQYNDQYIVNDWQVEKGKVLNHVFGIQRHDGVTYPDLMMFNRTLIKEALGEEAVMPDELWEQGEWTLDAFMTMVTQLDQHYRNTAISTVGLTPYYLGINAVNANGIELVDTTKTGIDQQLQLNKTIVSNAISEYTSFLFGANTNSIWYDADKAEYDDSFLKSNPVNKNHLYDTFKAGNIVIATFQNWQASGLSDVTFETSIVPFPQRGTQDNTKYISPIEAGDVLGVSRGTNSNEVATILMLMNKFMKGVQETFYENQRVNLGLPEDTSMDDIMAAVFVLQKTKNSTEADVLRAREIAAFIHGYHKDYKYVTRSSILAQVAGDDAYAMAIQRTLYEGGGAGYNSYINQQMERIKKSYDDVLTIVKKYD